MARATKRSGGASKRTKRATSEEHGEPKFPYTTKPASLRKFLQVVPTKPKPPKVVSTTLKTWGFTDSNDTSILRVLKTVGLLGGGGEPTDLYAAFMKTDTGPAALGAAVKQAYKELFEHVTDPEKAKSEELASFFRIHSGGAPATISLQAATFKALADSARFDSIGGIPEGHGPPALVANPPGTRGNSSGAPAFHMDLHIHLPENKSRADYDLIFSSIAEHILGKRS